MLPERRNYRPYWTQSIQFVNFSVFFGMRIRISVETQVLQYMQTRTKIYTFNEQYFVLLTLSLMKELKTCSSGPSCKTICNTKQSVFTSKLWLTKQLRELHDVMSTVKSLWLIKRIIEIGSYYFNCRLKFGI